MFVLIGSGPGIGLATATLFALKHSSQIVLISRNNERLQQDRQALLKTAAQEKHHGEVQVKTFAVDIADSQALAKVLLDVQKLGRLEVVLFNAARVQPSTLLETPMEVLEQDFKVSGFDPARPICPREHLTTVRSEGASPTPALPKLTHLHVRT